MKECLKHFTNKIVIQMKAKNYLRLIWNNLQNQIEFLELEYQIKDLEQLLKKVEILIQIDLL